MSNIKLVGEIGINHNGDVEVAKQLINIAKISGLDYVKFQKRDIDSCYTPEFLDSPRQSPWGSTQRDQKLGIEFNEDQYDEIAEHCIDTGIEWFGSPWDVKSVEFLSRYKNPYIKIASAMIHKPDVIQAIKDTKIPVILSTGMTTKDEFMSVFDILQNQIKYVLACTSTYPTKDEEVNLNFVKTLVAEVEPYGMKAGFSNHHPGIQYCISSAVLGAKMIEFHMTLDRSMYGSDQSASIETIGVLKIGKHIRNIELALGTGQWTVFESEQKIKSKLVS